MSQYTPPAGNEVELPLFPVYTPPVGSIVDLPVGELFGPPDPPDPFIDPRSILSNVKWARPVKSGLSSVIGHGLSGDLSKRWRAVWSDCEQSCVSHSIPWQRMAGVERSVKETWQETDKRGNGFSVEWKRLQVSEKGSVFRFGLSNPLENSLAFHWRLSVQQDVITGIPWARQQIRNFLLDKSWGIGRLTFPDWRVVWGQALPPRTIVPNPIIFDPPPPPPKPDPVYTPPSGDSVFLPFQCALGNTPSNQIRLPFRQFECLRRMTVVENDLILKRVDNDAEVPALSLSIRGDIETATNTWSAQMPLSALSIVEPTGTQPVECLASINGVDHLLLLERWSVSHGWDDRGGREDTVNVQGSSISRELDAPYQAPKSRFEELTRSAFQLMQQEIPLGSGWTLSKSDDWTDYAVPGGTFSYTDLTPLQVIVRIAAATGAVVQQIPDSRELRVIPRYKVAPWNWSATSSDKQVDFGLIVSATGEFQPTPKRNGIYVAGETNGIIAQCQRTGTAGDPWADMAVDSLITAPIAGLQRGIAELSATGARSLYSAQMPIKVSESTPGLILPGELIEVVEDESTSWKALSVDWSINGRWSDSDGLTVWADIGLERYRDD